jgi:hypothetical protein
MGLTGMLSGSTLPASIERFFPALAQGSEAPARTGPPPPRASGQAAAGTLPETRSETFNFSALSYEAFGKYTRGEATLGEGEAKGGDGGASIGFEQLEFSFTAELRAASLSQFNERTRAVEDGLEGPQRARFSGQRQAVAVRFELSIQISAAALQGYAAAAEGVQGNEDALDRLLQLTESLKKKSDDFFNETLALLHDFFSGAAGSQDFLASFNTLFDDLFAGFFEGLSLPGPAASAQTPSQGTANLKQLSFNFSFSAVSVEVSVEAEVQQGDPLVFDLDGDGIELTSYRDGARFDLLGNGRPVNTAFVTGGDALLAIDRNRNGLIDDGTELFGEQRGAANGFEELQKLDSNGDSVIDDRDAAFGDLLLWRDNGNGLTERGELITLRDAGIVRIDLNYRDVRLGAAGGNVISQLASYQRTDGSRGTAADVLLNYTA